jgi:membrane-bound lytic murein transglycosylase B
MRLACLPDRVRLCLARYHRVAPVLYWRGFAYVQVESKGWSGVRKRNAQTVTWRRVRQPSGGLVAISAVLLAASAASSSTSSAAGAPVVSDPEAIPVEAGADGGTPPDLTFPLVESHLASGRFVNALPPSVTGTIPSTVLAAYQRAVERTDLVQPNCHVPLELLAAIGKVESGHARGGRVDATGRTLSPILGPVLNGGPFAAIRDTDGGALDEDTSWDRAVGPMQFIPGTWSRWQADGNDDGRLDPHNVFDASLAAARYLCAANRDLGTPAGLDEAVLSYNHSTSYLSLVRSWMSVYRNSTITVEDITDVAWLPPETTPVTAPSTAPTSPTSPSTGPPTTPPTTPPSTPPTTPPSTPPGTPPTTPPSTPPSTPPTLPPPTAPSEPPVEEVPPEEPTEQCGLLDTVGGLVGGLLGESPDCVQPLELSTTATPPNA